MAIALVYAVFADREEADRIGHMVVEERLAACVNILGRIDSIYRWQGKVETGSECAALFKTGASMATALSARIAALHSYENPAILTLPAVDAPLPFLHWIDMETGADGDDDKY